MKVSMSTIAFLIFILMLSIFVAKVTNLIATDVETNVETIKPKYYDIDDSPDHLMWFLQISDIHISIFKDYSRITEFKEFCDITVRTIKPAVVLASGDLTDAKTKDAMGSKQILDEWEHYKRVLKETDVTKRTTWLDVRGNHDNFNVIARNSSENYYTNYSVQGRNHSRSYIHQISANKEKFSFIAIDACLDPGPRRPFNFIGLLDNKEVDHVKKLAQESRRLNSNYIIWFGHYPTSSILTEDTRNIRSIMGDYGEGLVYLCGHYHTLGGTLPEMYTLQHVGFLELELGDWKDNRLYRVAAVDHGQFSFIDVKHGDWPVILITNPKHALYTMPSKENFESIVKSTHIRVLAFSTTPIEKVEIKINDEPWIDCNHIEGPLYTIKWNPALYKSGIQIIRARVEDKNGKQKEITQPFVLDGTRLSFKLLSRFILMSNATTIFGVAFAIMHLLNIIPLWPWAIGEIIDDHVGVIFAWGMFIKNAYLPGSFTYAYGFFQLLSFHMPLTILLAHRIDKRFDEFDRPSRKSSSIFNIFWANLPFLLLIIMQTSMTYFFWLAYGTLATILCPLRTWSIILALVLWYQVYTLPNHCLKSAKYAWSTSKESTINNK
ncbi:Similar to TMEM62: Transmembrane protein 62 (Homo sapiens) [Cotesia congregata]|uniref:Similar to TMEM62: Transmembrane protein 62 (Homo sapiens) n=1 Tax=Cotesia congregata TaxID=51543 RepID=A0A8J2HND5_COTCN|nr:Similar to TMEM62: Transmembrane protein 62 (Homo sapiens) [Cotesia congregata]